MPAPPDPAGSRPDLTPPPATDRPRPLVTYLKGFAMGCADIVPGVSGGTIAMVVGVYEGLLGSLSALSSGDFLRHLTRGRLGRAFEAMNGALLFPLLAGIGTALVTLSRVIGHLLATYPGYVMAVFFGLVTASALVVGRRVARWRTLTAVALALGAGLGLVVVTLTPVETPSGTAFLFGSGFLAICAMVLPGISGAFVLVLLGKYDLALSALARFDLGVIVPIALGAMVGLLSFARLLSYLLKRHRDPMLALLTGFMVGSLYKVWPYVSPEGGATWPWAAGGAGAALLTAGLVVVGAVVVLALERLGNRAAMSARSRSSFSSTTRFTPRR